MRFLGFCSLLLVCVFSAGCAARERSISHSAYAQQGSDGGPGTGRGTSDPAFEYRGELSEFDVLGIDRGEITSDADIRRALEEAKPVKLRTGSSILLIQSGSLFPDGPMVKEFSKHFRVVSFSGVPGVRRTGAGAVQTESPDPEAYAKLLRLTAARGGAESIVCYWGVLESENEHLAWKTVSWVPVAHWFVPDEKQHMRIRLKIAVVDVRTGNWSTFSPAPIEDARRSTAPKRGTVDQEQVEHLKQLAYEATVAELMRAFD